MIHKRDRVISPGEALKLFRPKVRKALKCYKGFHFKTKMVSILANELRTFYFDCDHAIAKGAMNERYI